MLEKQTLELLAETTEGKKLRRQARKEGLEAGRKEGRKKGLLRAIRIMVRLRFPSLVGTIDINRFDYERTQRAFSALLAAKTVEEAGDALR